MVEFCADGSECWTPNCCGTLGCLKAAACQPMPGPPEPPTIDLDSREWSVVVVEEELC
jgi:hypothetical protein